MREIKFRTWNKNWPHGVCRPENMIISGMTYLDIDGKTYKNQNGKMVENGDILMQFTGLKDKNGKEIYEGDIIKTRFWNKNKGEFIEEDFVGEVQYWGESFASFNLLDKKERGIPLEWACHKNDVWKIYGEIIGNIYENPELVAK